MSQVHTNDTTDQYLDPCTVAARWFESHDERMAETAFRYLAHAHTVPEVTLRWAHAWLQSVAPADVPYDEFVAAGIARVLGN